jgi:hypothetical protein
MISGLGVTRPKNQAGHDFRAGSDGAALWFICVLRQAPMRAKNLFSKITIPSLSDVPAMRISS